MSTLSEVLRGSEEEREAAAERIADHLDGPMTVLGVVFLLLVVTETFSSPEGAVGVAFSWLSWGLWASFATEFVVRMVIAPSTTRFLKRNWWQLIFLAVPFLRFFRALGALRALRATRIGRVGRAGRVLSAAIRSSRTAGRRLSSRIAVLGSTTVVVVLAASQLLFELGPFDRYSDALHAAALATIAGQPIPEASGAIRLLEVALIGYSVVVFAALAGTVGAYLLARERQDAAEAASLASEG